MTTVHLLQAGYNGDRVASSITLVRDRDALIVTDPGLVASRARILDPLRELGVEPEDVTHVFLSHHHPDHMTNIALFPEAWVIDVDSRYKDDQWLDHEGDGYALGPNSRLWVTPGHTDSGTSLVVTADDATYAMTHLWWHADRSPEVDPLGDEVALVEAVGAFVGDRGVADLRVAILDPPGEVGARRVVPADRQVRVAGVELEGLRAAGQQSQRDGDGQRRRDRCTARPGARNGGEAAHEVSAWGLGGCARRANRQQGQRMKFCGCSRARCPLLAGGRRGWRRRDAQ